MHQSHRLAWLTPDVEPGGTTCRVLVIPDAVDWLAIVFGALLPLQSAINFEAYGTSTPEGTAARFQQMIDDATFEIGTCRVIGEIVCYSGATSPSADWLLCDGSSILRTDYPDLFTLIGTVYGSVDGLHFNLPDLAGRTVVGVGSGSGLTTRALGDSFGEETHTLITAEQASHSHLDSGHIHAEGVALPAVGAAIVGVPVPSAVPGIGATGSGSAVLGSSGGDGGHNNIQPSLSLNYFIVAQ